MLFATQNQPRLSAPNFFTTTRTQPLLTTFAHKVCRVDSCGMRCTAETCNRNSVFVAHRVVYSYTSLRIRNILDWPTHMHHASEVLAHESFVFDSPAWQIRRQGIVPEVYRRLDEIVGQHASANDTGVVVIELNSRDRYAWSNAVEDSRRKNSVGARIEVAL